MTESILEQAKLAHRRGDLRHALEVCEKGLASCLVEGSPKLRYELFVLKSHCLSALGQWQEALGALKSAPESIEIDKEAQARLAMDEGYLMGSLARYAECWTLLNQAEKNARELNLPTLLAEILWRRGMVSIFANEHTSAHNFLREALEIATTEKNRLFQGLTIAGLAKNLMYCRDYSNAIAQFEEASTIFKELDLPSYFAISQGEIGTCYMYLGELEKALKLLQSTAQIFLQNNFLPNYQVSLADIGNVYLRRGEFLTAISYYQQALELARELNDQLSIGKWLHNLAQAYSSLGNPALAQEFENEAKRVKESLAAERQRAAAIAASSK